MGLRWLISEVQVNTNVISRLHTKYKFYNRKPQTNLKYSSGLEVPSFPIVPAYFVVELVTQESDPKGSKHKEETKSENWATSGSGHSSDCTRPQTPPILTASHKGEHR